MTETTSGPTNQPGNVGNIMQDMFSKMVKPDPNVVTAPVQPTAATPVQPTAQPAVTEASPKPDIVLPEKIEVKVAEPEAGKIATDFFTDEPVEETVETAQVVDEEPDMSDVPDKPAAENFKKMREALKTDRKSLKAKERELSQTAAELEAWKKGEKIPEILTAKDTHIQKLEKIAESVNAHLSEEYQELVVKPIADTSKEFSKLAENYGVPAEHKDLLIKKIVETENEKDRNALITRYFPDAIGANKAKDLVIKMHELGQTAIEMEKKPAETRQTLQAQYADKLKAQDEKRAETFEVVSKNAWNQAMTKTKEEGVFSQLILDPTNPEHNKIVEKNQHRAAIQYSACVKEIFGAGAKNLPEKLATGIARSIALGIAGVGALKELNAVKAELAAIKKSSSVQTTYFRPGANGNGSSQAPAKAPEAPKNPIEAAKIASQSLNRR